MCITLFQRVNVVCIVSQPGLLVSLSSGLVWVLTFYKVCIDTAILQKKYTLSSLVKKHKWYSVFLVNFLSYIRTCWFDCDQQKWNLLCLINYFIFHFKIHLIILVKLLAHIFSVLKSNSTLFIFYIFPSYRNNNNYIYSC